MNGPVSPPAAQSADQGHVLDRHLRFCLDFHRRLTRNPHATLCWSPFSVASALGLLVDAARGRSREELTRVLLGDATAELTRYGAMIGEASNLDDPFDHHAKRNPLLAVHNTLWADTALTLRPDFTQTGFSSWPAASVRRVPLRTAPHDARHLINREIADQTRGLVQNLLPATAVLDQTVAILANALYLRATWRTPFPERNTHTGGFNTVDGRVDATMMRVRARLPYSHAHGWQLVDLAAHGAVSLTVLIPSAPLMAAEPALTPGVLTDLLFGALPRSVQLTLPRLNIGAHMSLTGAVRAAGAPTVFSDSADLTGVVNGPVTVSDLLHETTLRIDERGVEAASATAAAVTRSAPLDTCYSVVADRPFLLLVRHRPSNTIYYMARVTTP